MPRRDRLRRVVLLCRAFAWNLAYYRVGQRKEYSRAFKEASNANANFWRAANSNNIDICILEWCKLFADEKAKHYWARIVSDPTRFKVDLLQHLGIGDGALQGEISIIREYRDKFLAHLDSEYTMNMPKLDLPKKAVWFYHAHVVNHEALGVDLNNIDDDIRTLYRRFELEAVRVYKNNS